MRVFDLRIPESMAALPGRVHCLADGPAPRPPKPARVRQCATPARTKAPKVKQCVTCGESCPTKLTSSHGKLVSLCKACNLKRVQAYYAKNGRKSRAELRAMKAQKGAR